MNTISKEPTVLHQKITENFIFNKKAAVGYVEDLLKRSVKDLQLTMTTAPAPYGDCYVHIATKGYLVDTEILASLKPQQPTSVSHPQAGSSPSSQSSSGVPGDDWYPRWWPDE